MTLTRIFVTGGHGFLGRHLVRRLEAKAHVEVVAPTRAECPLFAPDAINVITKAMEGCDTLIHAAADVGGLLYVNTERFALAADNIQMSINVLVAARNAGIRRVITIGSACSYPPSQAPLREVDFWEGPPHPSVEAYGGYKRTLEMLARQREGVCAIHLPLASLYGPGDKNLGPRAHVLTALIEKVVRAKREKADFVEAFSPDTWRELMHVEDAADAIARLTLDYDSAAPLFNPGIVNIGTGQEHQIYDLMDMVQKAAHVEIPVHWDASAPTRGVHRKVLDVARLKRVLPGWKLMNSIERGIQQTVEWFEAR